MKRFNVLSAVLLALAPGCAEPPPPGECCMDQSLVLQCEDETSLWDGYAPPYGTYSPIDPGDYQPEFQVRIDNTIFTVDACPGDWGTDPDGADLKWEEDGLQ